MKRKRILGLLCICLVLTAGVFGKHFVEYIKECTMYLTYEECVLGIPCVEAEEVLYGKQKATMQENDFVAFEGIVVPYDKTTNTLYLPQNYQVDTWEGNLESLSTDWDIYVANDSTWDDKKKAISENYEFTLWLVGDQQYFELHLIITGTPVINICTEYAVEAEEIAYEENPDKLFYGSETQMYGTISVFDPGNTGRQYEVIRMRVRYHQKGASTKGFEKKGYSLSMLNQKEQNTDVSLLGMRSDNSWKLNALMTDSSKVREITASQIWEKFDETNAETNETGPRIEYVELILDGEYRGLYCLVEPVDEEKMELDNNDVLYKVIDWNLPDDEGIQDSANHGWPIAYPIRIRYPEVINSYQTAWYPIRDYLNVFYRETQLSAEELIEKVNLDNLIDIAFFTMVTSASDNVYKNTYYVAEVSDTGSYIMKQIPWDLDYTFGNEYQYGAHNNVAFNAQYDEIYIESALFDIYNADREEIGDLIWEKWSEYRATFLSYESIEQLFIENRDYIVQTGAAARDEEKWEEAVNTDLNGLLDYLEKRLEWLDIYFSQW